VSSSRLVEPSSGGLFLLQIVLFNAVSLRLIGSKLGFDLITVSVVVGKCGVNLRFG
jgi:hypothetical protein